MNMDKYYPYNAVNGDRKHDADDIARMIGAVITTGVAMAPSNSLQVLAGGDFKVTVKAGICVIDGRIGINDNDKTFTIAAPSAGANRIDRIVARADYTNRVNSLLYVQGTPASSPQPPGLTNSTTARDISLARIYVGQTVSSITQSAITDERTACGLAAPSPIDALMSQFRDSFNNWMNGQETTFQSWADRVQAALESTEAGQVLSLITQLQTGKQDALSASKPLSLAAGGWGASLASYDEARAKLGLRNLYNIHFQAGMTSITVPAGSTTATLTITYDDAFAYKPLYYDVGLWGTNYPGAYGGKWVGTGSVQPTDKQITLAVQIGAAQSSNVSIPVCWIALGYHN